MTEKPKRLPLLSHFSKRNMGIFERHALLFVTHLLHDSVPYMTAFKDAGANPEHTVIVGIPYSSKEDAVKELRQDYPFIFCPTEFPFDDAVEKALKKCYEICREKDLGLIIVEDGGYAVPIMHSTARQCLDNCIGAVEQTPNGIWRDEQVDLQIPVLSIPDCELKKRIEPPFIGNAVVRNTINLLSETGEFLAGREVGLIGYGRIGEQIAKALRSEKAIVSVAEIQYINLLAARFEGFKTLSIEQLVKQSDVIVGATGTIAIHGYLFNQMKENTILINASSKRMEFNHSELEEMSVNIKKGRIGTQYKLKNGRNILLLANGFPVNFFSSESVPDKVIDIILTLMFRAAALLAKLNCKKTLTPRIYSWAEEDSQKGVCINEECIAKHYYKLHFNKENPISLDPGKISF